MKDGDNPRSRTSRQSQRADGGCDFDHASSAPPNLVIRKKTACPLGAWLILIVGQIMTAEEQRKIREAHDALPPGCRSKPASEAALRAFEAEFGPIPADYRWYLAECGGGVVHSEWLDDIDALRKSHAKFRAEAAYADGWKKKDGFLIGWDGGGNPMIIDRRTGEVVVEDHDFGGVHVEARSFADFCLKSA